ncbi:flagellar protein FlaG [Herbaspirillum sp. Sphag1AN]|uniref:flagellar protein FlaG n=1 Tax=unclassified Herbaspirillum TaxID=2624150 RepID=UPI00161DCEB3|nr:MULTISPECIES: flagellar protein FlaG [unclassified Herbaspirillum]MBB3211005.1 flagellar protein FlaG [Herbaspirillum sp. Sphag1AN]MBB3244634.1 flagellar protein FlaG [Herbaspirillum sp. Sphag64]
MSISPLNITAAGDSGAYAPIQPANRPDPVVSTVAPVADPQFQNSSENSSDKDVANAVDKLNDFARQNASDLDFSQDKETGKTIVRVVDTATDTVIRQIPSEEAIAIAKSIDKMQGVLINHKA